MEHAKGKESWAVMATFKKRQLLNVLTRRHFIKIISIASPTWASMRNHLLLLNELLLRWRHRLNRRCWLLSHHRWVEGCRWHQRLRWHCVHWQRIFPLNFRGRRWRWIWRCDSLLNDIVWLVEVAVLRDILVLLLLSRRGILALENRWNAWGDVQVVEWIWLCKKLEN